MNKRGSPINTRHSSNVIYPSALFSLEKDEIFPYERFAYCLLEVGVEALHARGLPERMTIDFTGSPLRCSPWSINASVSFDLDHAGSPTSFRFAIPELFPAILYMFAAVVAAAYFDEEKFATFRHDPTTLGTIVQRFADGASAGVRVYRDKGIGPAVRASYEHLGLTFNDLQECLDDFDLLAKQISYHEVAHAYIQQVTRQGRSTPSDKIAFELIADLVATEWFYGEMIRNTPDSAEYRQLRGMNSYADTIFANSLMTLQSQQTYLMLMAIAGAQGTGGAVSLAGGRTHPPGLQRYQLQHVHLYTLIESNFSAVLSVDEMHRLDDDWNSKIGVLVQSGLIPLSDLETMLSTSECDSIEVAANLIEELGISELKKVLPLLRDWRDSLADSLRKNGKKPT